MFMKRTPESPTGTSQPLPLNADERERFEEGKVEGWYCGNPFCWLCREDDRVPEEERVEE